MAISKKYGTLTVSKVEDEEPVFIIRAQDRLAVPAIQMYKALAESHDLELAGELEGVIEDFRQWKGKTKMPD